MGQSDCHFISFQNLSKSLSVPLCPPQAVVFNEEHCSPLRIGLVQKVLSRTSLPSGTARYSWQGRGSNEVFETIKIMSGKQST